MRIFMSGLIALGAMLILAGLIGRLGPHRDQTRGGIIQFSAHEMSMVERLTFITVGSAIVVFGVTLNRKRR